MRRRTRRQETTSLNCFPVVRGVSIVQSFCNYKAVSTYYRSHWSSIFPRAMQSVSTVKSWEWGLMGNHTASRLHSVKFIWIRAMEAVWWPRAAVIGPEDSRRVGRRRKPLRCSSSRSQYRGEEWGTHYPNESPEVEMTEPPDETSATRSATGSHRAERDDDSSDNNNNKSLSKTVVLNHHFIFKFHQKTDGLLDS